MDGLEKTIGYFFHSTSSLCIISKTLVNSNWSYSPETPNAGQNQLFFGPMWPWNLMDHISWKTKGYLSNAMPSSVHHFKAIGEFKLELQPGNAQFGSKSAIFVPCDLEIWWMILNKNMAPLLCYFKLCFNAIGEFKLELQSGNGQFRSKSEIFVPRELEIRWMTLKDNRASFLCYFQLCTLFQNHRWIQTGVTFRKCSIFRPLWPWNLTDALKIKKREPLYVTSSFVHNFVAICEFKLE